MSPVMITSWAYLSWIRKSKLLCLHGSYFKPVTWGRLCHEISGKSHILWLASAMELNAKEAQRNNMVNDFAFLLALQSGLESPEELLSSGTGSKWNSCPAVCMNNILSTSPSERVQSFLFPANKNTCTWSSILDT